MKRVYIQTRKHANEEYKFYACVPEYRGEKGILGIEIEPYIEVETEPNCFGYIDTILLSSNGNAYSLNRYRAKWILEKLARQMEKALAKFIANMDMDWEDYAEEVC